MFSSYTTTNSKVKLFFRFSKVKKSYLVLFSTLISTTLFSLSAQALPSFARQTGQECAACHVGAFGPQLTPYGQKFKIGGYTDKAGNDSPVPVSAMLVGVFDQTSKDLPENAGPHNGTNNNSALQEASIFVAGGVTDNLGGLIQVTYSGIERKTSIDNVDIRYARPVTIADEESIVGISVNNNPTNQDPWNTVPAWGFPYMAADLAPGPNGAPLIAGGLEQQVLGVTAYVSWNDKIYAEAGGYRTQSNSLLKRTHVIETADDVSEVSGTAPYWRLAYSDSFNRQNMSVGLFGLQADIHPGRQAGPVDKYNDVGVDASYQFMGTRRHIFSLNASLIHETQELNATLANDGAERKNNQTDALNLNGSYYFKNTYGATLGYFNNHGSKMDNTLFAENPVDGSRLGHSDSSGFVVQADYTPFGKEGSSVFANVRLGLQYTIYNKYNGASKNYDGFGRNASDNNTLMMMVWTSI